MALENYLAVIFLVQFVTRSYTFATSFIVKNLASYGK